jgi:hypothetical protein
MATEDACEHDMRVELRWQGRTMAIPPTKLAAINPDESTDEAIGNWRPNGWLLNIHSIPPAYGLGKGFFWNCETIAKRWLRQQILRL